MDIKNARELSKIITLCRKKGVQTIKVATDGSIELTLSENPPARASRASRAESKKAEAQAEEQKQYTDEEVLMWSVPTPAVSEEN